MSAKESRSLSGTEANGKGRNGVDNSIIHQTARVADACRHASQAIADEAWRDPAREATFASAATDVWQSYRYSLRALNTLIQARRSPADSEMESEAAL